MKKTLTKINTQRPPPGKQSDAWNAQKSLAPAVTSILTTQFTLQREI